MMKMRQLVVALAIALVGLGSPVLLAGGAAHGAELSPSVHSRTCTKTSSGTCIRGGQFCPQASYGHAGYDASGRKYICKGDRSHPHWMKP